MVKVSQICTVKNEGNTIARLLDSLLGQTRQPDEIIIVDGGSTDDTLSIIRSYIDKGANFRLIVEEGANISRGRNIAIKNSRYDVIASTDAGCEPRRTWLEHLIEPFERDPTVDVVSGAYQYTGVTPFERAVARILSRRMPMLDNVMLPSARSIAFKKSAWHKVGGFPEDCRFAEDTTFGFDLKAEGCKFSMAEDAVVLTRTRENPRMLCMQYFNYSRWDVIARNLNSKGRVRKAALLMSMAALLVPLTILSAPVGITILSLAVIYYFVRYGVLLSGPTDIRNVINGPLVVLTIMMGETAGTISGLLSNKRC